MLLQVDNETAPPPPIVLDEENPLYLGRILPTEVLSFINQNCRDYQHPLELDIMEATYSY